MTSLRGIFHYATENFTENFYPLSKLNKVPSLYIHLCIHTCYGEARRDATVKDGWLKYTDKAVLKSIFFTLQ